MLEIVQTIGLSANFFGTQSLCLDTCKTHLSIEFVKRHSRHSGDFHTLSPSNQLHQE